MFWHSAKNRTAPNLPPVQKETEMINVMILFGGNSPEHEVSLRSAATVYSRLDRRLFRPVPVGITRGGRFYRTLPPKDGAPFSLSEESLDGGPLTFTPGEEVTVGGERIGFVFPMTHGAFGEDGRLQGFLEMLGVPYAGCRTVGSAVCMDKDLTKRLCAAAGIPVVPSETIRRAEEASAAAARIGFPLVVKPANAGSSRGVAKVKTEADLAAAVGDGFAFDSKVLLERCLNAREIECAVIGSGPFTVFPPGEVVTSGGFYDYKSKYFDNGSTAIRTRADLPPQTVEKIRALAAEAAERCEVRGFARIDFFLEKESGHVFLNEINTLPGFTGGSLFPLMCEENGLNVTDALTEIIRLGLKEFEERPKFEPAAE